MSQFFIVAGKIPSLDDLSNVEVIPLDRAEDIVVRAAQDLLHPSGPAAGICATGTDARTRFSQRPRRPCLMAHRSNRPDSIAYSVVRSRRPRGLRCGMATTGTTCRPYLSRELFSNGCDKM